METKIDEIADGVFRISTFAPSVGIAFNQYLLRADQPLLFHTGMRMLFPMVHDAMAKVLAPKTLRWISFGHYEADESGGMNLWLANAPQAEVTHGAMACMLSLNDQAERAPHALKDSEVLDLGGKRVRWLDTPHVPHGWEAGVMFEETTGVLLSGDLFTQLGDCPPLSDGDIVGPAIAAEDMFRASSLHPSSGAQVRRLAALAPRTLALMHGPAFNGDCGAALNALADDYDRRISA